MRLLCLALTLVAAAAAGYLGTLAKNSYSGYSTEQLEQLDQELVLLQQKPHGAEDAQLAHALLQEERLRRTLLPVALGVAGLAGLASLLVRGSRGGPQSRRPSDEEARLVAAVGSTPQLTLEAARRKAAELLGVSPSAPASVVEAALQVQLQERDPAQLHGLSPDLKQVVLKQREALMKARDLLLDKRSIDGLPTD